MLGMPMYVLYVFSLPFFICNYNYVWVFFFYLLFVEHFSVWNVFSVLVIFLFTLSWELHTWGLYIHDFCSNFFYVLSCQVLFVHKPQWSCWFLLSVVMQKFILIHFHPLFILSMGDFYYLCPFFQLLWDRLDLFYNCSKYKVKLSSKDTSCLLI